MAVVIAGLTLAAPASAATLPPGFDDELVTLVTTPTAMAFTPDGRMLITTSPGDLRVYEGGQLLATPALSLRDRVCADKERGLLGVVAHPSFASNHVIYLYYTYDRNDDCGTDPATGPVNRVARFVLGDDNVVDPASEIVLMDGIPAFHGIHNAGDLHFGRDGFLYVSIGDGGCYYLDPARCATRNPVAQELNSVQGKIVRITDTGGIPTGNPYTGPNSVRCDATGAAPPGKQCREIYARGFRNPFRFTFDRDASPERIFVNDVGGSKWEEFSLAALGGNFGWPLREGACVANSTVDCPPPPAGLIDPIYGYPHADGCAAITAGTFVPQGVWPPEYDRSYIFGDFVCGRLWRLAPASAGGTVTDFGIDMGWLVGAQFGPAGTGQAMYYLIRGSDQQIRRIRYVGAANRRPRAVASADPTSGDDLPLTVAFRGSDSSDDDDDLLTYAWDFGDGSQASTAADPSHTYTVGGRYTATLTVTDPDGASDADTVQIDAGNTPPTPVIDAPLPSKRFIVGESIVLHGHATDQQDGAMNDASLTWEARLRHNEHVHPYLDATTGNDVELVAPPPEDLTAAASSHLEILLTATDSQGLTKTIVQDLRPNPVTMRFETAPAGLTVGVNEVDVTGPGEITAWEGQAVDLVAAEQLHEGRTWALDEWSDGGTPSHRVSASATPAMRTAHFAPEHSTVEVSGTDLLIRGAARTGSRLSIEQGADGLRIADLASPVTAGTGCTSASDSEAICGLAGVGRIVAKGGAGDDEIAVTASLPALIEGGSGADELTGGGRDDVLDGGMGGDVMEGGGGTDTVTYAARTAPVTVRLDALDNDGESGERDRVGADVENVRAGAGNDTLVGSSAANVLEGGSGDDYLEPGLGRDTIAGGPGTFDRVAYPGSPGPVSITLDGLRNDGMAGEDDLVGADVESAYGSPGADTLTGSDGPNRLMGRDGDDMIDGRLGTDIVSGGNGSDTASYRARNAPVSVSLDGIKNDGAAGENDDIGTDFENLEGGDHSDTLTGDAGPNTLLGGAGDDRLVGGSGADLLTGQAGSDTADYGARTAPVTLRLDGVAQDGEAGEKDDIRPDIERLRGGGGADTIVGDDRDNVLDGGPGDDYLEPKGGTDTVIGGPGAVDRVSYTQAIVPVRVSLDGIANDGATGENDHVGADVEAIYGGRGSDTLIGDAGPNRLLGSGGDDTLDGGGGADFLGGEGGLDTATYASRAAPVTVRIDGLANDGETGEKDRVVNDIERVIGGEGNDTLVGGAADESIVGGPGNDYLEPGFGRDVVQGGTGVDRVSYTARVAPVTVTLDGTDNDGGTGEGDLAATDVEQIRGGKGADVLVGDGRTNTLWGGEGADTLDGGGGPDILAGEQGTDTASYASRFARVEVRLNGVADDGEFAEGDDVRHDTENVVGGLGSDWLTGNDLANRLVGGSGRDTFEGAGGDDTLHSRDDNPETVACGAGTDTVIADLLDAASADCETVDGQRPAAASQARRTRRARDR